MIFLSYKHIEDYIEGVYIEQGEPYVEKGMIQFVDLNDKVVKAKVLGEEVYDISLRLSKQGLKGQCTCASFKHIGPCKHVAAVALAIVAEQEEGYMPSSICLEEIDRYESLDAQLDKMKKQELARLLSLICKHHPKIMDEVLQGKWNTKVKRKNA